MAGLNRGAGGLVLLALLLAAAAWATRATGLESLLSAEGLVQALERVRASPWAPIVFIVGYAVATGLALPGTVFTLAGGAVFGFVPGVLWNWLGANLGATLAFLLARALGRDGLDRLLGERAAALDRIGRTHGARTVLLLRLIPVVPFNGLNFAAGLAGVRWRGYALATALGIVPGTAVYTWFAEALLEGSRAASRDALLRVLAAGGLLVLLGLVPVLARRLGVRLPVRSPDGTGGDP
ncbi:MAG: TVP38/TMEM64 family protein [Gemmatimonadota bacterium]|nr:TVP38/TMEM64 family protein [Gemmatimonadota bacterium]